MALPNGSPPAAPGDAAPARRRPSPLMVAGVASLGNGVAVVLSITTGMPLGGLLLIVWTVNIGAFVTMSALGGARTRATILKALVVGIVVGVVAVVAYDATKAALSQLDPSPYDPFEVTRRFGVLLTGPGTSAAVVSLVGWAFHLLNGITFTIVFACLFARSGRISRRRGIATGIAWGLFLETFQLALYPGWMSIGFIDEFRRISFLAHLVFGTLLGLLVPAGLRWIDRRTPQLGGGPGG